MAIADDPAVRGLLMLTAILKASGRIAGDSAVAVVNEVSRGTDDDVRRAIWDRANEIMPGFLRD